jgi:glycosyltransferase involved in cell wall biosynthesis
MTRVMFIGDHLGYPDGVLHGGTVYSTAVFPAIAAQGIVINCCYLGHAHAAAGALRDGGVPVHFLSTSRWNPLGLWRLLREVQRMQPALLHLSGQKASLLGRVVARWLRVPVLVHVHDFVPVPALVRMAYRMVSGPRDGGLAVSSAVAEVVAERYGLRMQQVHTLWNGLPDHWFAPMVPVYPVPADAVQLPGSGGPVLLVVGRFFPVKGQLRLIEMMPELLGACPNLNLWLVGDGPTQEQCQARVAALGIADRVHFLGQRADVRKLMEAAWVVAVPSDSEGLSTVAMEAAACGRPVVAFDCGGTREVIINGETGVLVRAWDNKEFSDAMARLLVDEALRQRLSVAAAAAANRFSLQRHVDGLIRVYNSLVTSK